MASRKKAIRPPRQQRTGLRSQARRLQQTEAAAAAGSDPAWDVVQSSDEGEGVSQSRAAAAAQASGSRDHLRAMMGQFLAAQSKREETLLAEIRGLRTSLLLADVPLQLPVQSRAQGRSGSVTATTETANQSKTRPTNPSSSTCAPKHRGRICRSTYAWG